MPALAVLSAVALASPAVAADPGWLTEPAGAPGGTVQSPAGGSFHLPGLDGSAYTVTLITGDKVSLIPDGTGGYGVEVDPAQRHGGPLMDLTIRRPDHGEALYVTPDDAVPLINAGVLDAELFNVGYLAAHGYADGDAAHLPVIVGYAGGAPPAAGSLPGTSRTSTLASIGGAGLAVDKDAAGKLWAAIGGDRPGAAPAGTGAVERVWLDRKVEVTLQDSVPQVGAPAAWDAGYDGTGSTACVIDTGIDLAHPDVGAGDTFTYRVADDQAETGTGTVHVTVGPQVEEPDPEPPAALDDIDVTRLDTSVTIPVLDNDIGDPVRIADVDGQHLVSDPANGTVVVNEDQSVTYTPDEGFLGNDEFQYLVTDGTGELVVEPARIGTVRVTVGPAEGPVAVDDVVTIRPGTPVPVAVLDNDLGDGLSVVEAADPAHGSVTVNQDQTVTYHPEAGFGTKLRAARSFVPGEVVQDEHGHGTHVASTVAGTGAASDGLRTGVAPGADLVVAKALNSAGSGLSSWIIEAMEWCAVDQAVEVINMSLGGDPTDGTDPLSQAVDALTAATGALFVIAAGNAGAGPFTVASPGAATTALTVGSVTKSDVLAGSSSRGPRLLDYAIKPEITAPGVDITAAIPGGGYGSSSGTSMATPHVAGAAAVLAQQHPDWQAEELKSALVATAADLGYPVYEQGSGRLDLARAVSTPVRVSPATADFRLIPDDQVEPPEPRVLTYTNPTGAPVTLDLTAALTTTAGEPVPAGTLSLDRRRVAVPAGGTATVTVSVSPAGLGRARYTGSIVATTDDGVRLTTPVGFGIDKPKHRLTVRLVNADQHPHYESRAVRIIGIDGSDDLHEWLLSDAGCCDTWEAWVTEGSYTVTSHGQWLEPTTDRVQRGQLVAPTVAVTGDTEVVLDAATLVPIRIETPEPTDLHRGVFTYQRWVPEPTDGLGWDWWEAALDQRFHHDFWVTPTAPVTGGELRYSSQVALTVPMVRMAVTHPEPRELAVFPQKQDPASTGAAVPRFAGSRTLELVDAGGGTAAEFDGLDVAGKLVLLDSGSAGGPGTSPCGMHPDARHRAAVGGATGLVVVRGPAPATRDHCAGSGYESARDPDPLAVPVVSIPFGDALALRELLAAGSGVQIQVDGSPVTPHRYSLRPVEAQRIPDLLRYRFAPDELAVIEHHFHANDVPRSFWDINMWTRSEGRIELPPIGISPVRLDHPPYQSPPWTLTEYVGPVGPGTETVIQHRVTSTAASPTGSAVRQVREFALAGPDRITVRWNDAPPVPGAVPAAVGDLVSHLVCAGCRQGDVFYPQYFFSSSSDPRQRGGLDRFSDFGNPDLRLFRDGEEVPQSPDAWFGVYASFALPPEPASYRLTHRVAGSDPAAPAVDTAWEFTSQQVTEPGIAPPYKCTGTLLEELAGVAPSQTPCAAQPLIFLRYDLGLDLWNRVRAPGAHRFQVQAYRQESLAAMPEIAGLTVSLSYDGGETWREARVRPAGGGVFAVTAIHPSRPRRASDVVSIRAEAWDAGGNRVEQTITGAYRLADRTGAGPVPG